MLRVFITEFTNEIGYFHAGLYYLNKGYINFYFSYYNFNDTNKSNVIFSLLVGQSYELSVDSKKYSEIIYYFISENEKYGFTFYYSTLEDRAYVSTNRFN